MIAQRVMEGSRRSLSRFPIGFDSNAYWSAAQEILHKSRSVLIITGFIIPEANAGETDGLLGAVGLSCAMQYLGKQAAILTDSPHHFYLKKIHPVANCYVCPVGVDAEQWLDSFKLDFDPDTIIAIERPGPDSDGRCLTARQCDISDKIAPLHRIYSASLTVGIGDGGNELGMGIFEPVLREDEPKCCIKSRFTLTGATSNWAAYGLLTALSVLASYPELIPDPDEEIARLESIVNAGAVDGMTCKSSVSVDGYGIDANRKLLIDLRNGSAILTRLRSAMKLFQQDQTDRYGVFCGDLRCSYNFSQKCSSVYGYLATESQADRLKSLLREIDSGVQFDGEILGEVNPGEERNLRLQDQLSHPVIEFVQPERYPCDLLDKPKGRLTTQLVDWDGPGRKIWETDLGCVKWTLIQTPDRAMGWSDKNWTSVALNEAGLNLWKRAIQPQSEALVPVRWNSRQFESIAATYEGLPYLWGGRTEAGLDCSALVQLIFIKTGVLLPRHSLDQRRIGLRISFSGADVGDLIFAHHKETSYHHVAIRLNSGILHACRSKHKVVLESDEEFLTLYKKIAIRRILRFTENDLGSDLNSKEDII